jgi:predicted PhzF superfamily epimerase YddE/YHI9
MKLPYFHVDAFAGGVFRGNPAGVCPLAAWLPDATLQSIAAENNLSETAFIVGRGEDYDLRWFTPTIEVDLCGHATLAAAFVLFTERGVNANVLRFHSRSGVLTVSRKGESVFTLDFPSRPAVPCAPPDALIRGLGAKPGAVLKARDYLAVFTSEAAVRALKPDFAVLKTLDCLGIIATAPGLRRAEVRTETFRSADGGSHSGAENHPASATQAGGDCDFVSRFFAPGAGVDEDPVTGSAHCTLIPYWAQRLGKTTLFARQVSRRGGELACELAGERVRIGGKAVLYLRGEIEIENAATS